MFKVYGRDGPVRELRNNQQQYESTIYLVSDYPRSHGGSIHIDTYWVPTRYVGDKHRVGIMEVVHSPRI